MSVAYRMFWGLAVAAILFSATVAGAQTAAPAGQARRGQSDFSSARASRRLTALRTTGPIVIDGVLEEHDWAEAPVARGFIQNEPREGEPATEDTEVRMLYDSANLYVGVFAHDKDPNGIIVNELKKDFAENNGDVF